MLGTELLKTSTAADKQCLLFVSLLVTYSVLIIERIESCDLNVCDVGIIYV